jgi:hypothetical protein
MAIRFCGDQMVMKDQRRGAHWSAPVTNFEDWTSDRTLRFGLRWDTAEAGKTDWRNATSDPKANQVTKVISKGNVRMITGASDFGAMAAA